MSSGQTTSNSHIANFWDVFIEEIPRVPTVDELICRVVAINYPEGLVRDRRGMYIFPPRDAQSVTEQILSTLETAIESERDFWMRQLRRKGFFTPYAWGVRLSANIAITEANAQILEALEGARNIYRLDRLFWEAFSKTESFCYQTGRNIQWAPFQQ